MTIGDRFRAGRPNIPSFYSPTSFFNRPFGPSDTLAADQTPALGLANQINYGRQSGYTFQGYSGIGYGPVNWPYCLSFSDIYASGCPVFCVRPSDPSQNITYQKVTGVYNAGGWFKWYYWPDLQARFNTVPMPDKSLCPLITGSGNQQNLWGGQSGNGGDQNCFIWNLDTDEGYEFWVFDNASTSSGATKAAAIGGGTNWTCQAGGYIPSVSKFSGVFPEQWGNTATSLGAVGGAVGWQDKVNAFHGEPICHAIACALGINGSSNSNLVAPATRADGHAPSGNWITTIPTGYPNVGAANPAFGHDMTLEAQRFRFPANVDLSYLLPNYPLGWAIACAIRDYGLYNVNSSAGGCAIPVEDARTVGSPYNQYGKNAVDPHSLAWPGSSIGNTFGGIVYPSDPTGWSVLHHLPWGQLQLVNPIVS